MVHRLDRLGARAARMLVLALMLLAPFLLLSGRASAQPSPAPAQEALAEPAGAQDADAAGPSLSITSWVAILAALAILPFLLTMITPFAKLVVVGGVLRQALGTAQIPPTSVITGLALILTIHIMSPVVLASWEAYEAARALPESADRPPAMVFAESTEPIVRRFLLRNSDPRNVALFASLRERFGTGPLPERAEDGIVARALEIGVVHTPAFVLTELTEAFQIGFLIFIPFLIIDLVVSNLLLALGMPMLTPTTISLPLKILLFVLIDGWRLIFQGLVVGYPI